MKTLGKGLILLMMISLVKAQSPEGIWVDQVQIIEEKGAPDLIGNERKEGILQSRNVLSHVISRLS